MRFGLYGPGVRNVDIEVVTLLLNTGVKDFILYPWENSPLYPTFGGHIIRLGISAFLNIVNSNSIELVTLYLHSLGLPQIYMSSNKEEGGRPYKKKKQKKHSLSCTF